MCLEKKYIAGVHDFQCEQLHLCGIMLIEWNNFENENYSSAVVCYNSCLASSDAVGLEFSVLSKNADLPLTHVSCL